MASVNRVTLIGNLGRDPDMRYLPSGEAVANLALATTDKYKDKSGEIVENTEWHRISFFGKTAEVCGQYLKKGSQIYVEGALRTRKYIDKEGVEKYATDIRGDRLQMLGSRKDGDRQTERGQPDKHSASHAATNAQRPADGGNNAFSDMDSDIPFFDSLGRTFWMVV